MRMSKRLLMGLISVVFLFGVVGLLTPTKNHATYFDTFKKDKCDVPPTWGDIIYGKKRWVKKWRGAAYCDRMTGLVWDGKPSSQAMTWGGAQLHCLNRTLEGDKGKKGWRMASAPELASLVDTGSSSCQTGGGCLPDGNPFTNVQLSPYWATSTFPGNPMQAWFVGFDIGNVDCFLSTEINDDPITLPAWCVRGAPHADVY